MFSESLPGSATTLGSAAVGCGSAAALYLLILRPASREQVSQIVRSALGGALLIAGPLVVLLYSQSISPASITIALALTPVVIAVAEAATHHASETLAGRLWPGLAAIAGLLLLLVQPSLANPAEDLVLTLAPLLTGCGAVLFCSARSGAWRVPAALFGAAAALGLGAGINVVTQAGAGPGNPWPQMAGLAAGLDAVEALLALLALSRLSATRWSAQFAIVPLLVLLEAMAMTPSSIQLRMIVGLLLLSLAATALLMPPSEEPSFDLGASAPHPSHSD